MSIDTLNPQSSPTAEEVPLVSKQQRAMIMGKLVHQLMSLDEVKTKEVKPIVEALQVERDRNITPLFHSLDGLVVLRHQHPDEQEAIDSLISDTADLVLGDVTTIREVERKTEIGIHVVWTAINAWDRVRDESTSKLCDAMIKGFWGTGRASLLEAFNHAKKTNLLFDTALNQVNAAETLIEKGAGLPLEDALDQIYISENSNDFYNSEKSEAIAA
ncbi:MAG: hypothetical protein JWM00_287 [Candidatus Saccharibacteria bacterium]|nr:hypothetical protein [Candidatus Saccharibacteria bacterium]